MAVLNSWQRIDRVLSGKPFGDGADGAYSSATIPTIVYKSCSGTADSTTLTASTSSPFEVGDVILIHQSRGTGVGQWEINRIASVGSGEYTLQTALKYTYAAPAQAIKIFRYSSVTTSSGTWTVPSWNQTIQGILPIACSGTSTLTGLTISGNGGAGTSNIQSDGSRSGRGTGGGYYGGHAYNGNGTANQGEGTAGTGTTSRDANGSGGGGGQNDGSGAGGGHSTAGANGGGANPGTGGSALGADADLTTITFGGGGGGGARVYSYTVGGGGAGGAIIMMFAKTFDSSGATIVRVNGGAGGNANLGGSEGMAGGGGSGGSILVVCETATLGTSKLTATLGAGGSGSGNGGTGRAGRIAIHHSGTVTGTTNPTFTDVEDSTLVEASDDIPSGFSYFM
jgi:hypothetical protein